jgi:hypothetical protein
MIAVGTKDVGKTYTTRKEIAYQVIHNKRKVLLYDASLNPELKNYKTLPKQNKPSVFICTYSPMILKLSVQAKRNLPMPAENIFFQT